MKETRILIVDDNLPTLCTLVKYLERSGFEVLVASSGERALEQLERIRPDLILLDILMPWLDGFETCRRLKENELTKDIPVIFMTALSDMIDKMKGFEVGGVDYLTKPLQHQEVLARVTTHLKIRKLQEQLRTQNVRLEEQNLLLEENNKQLQQEIIERKQAEDVLMGTLEQIELAKQEWESTADSLSYVVCLLDKQMRIIRANRTVEHWHLGQVLTVKGKKIHDLLHPNCHEPDCSLHRFLNQAQREVEQNRVTEYEAIDPLLRRYLNIQLRPISDQSEKEEHISASFAVCTVHDVTERKRVEDSLQRRTQELVLLNQMSELLQACHTEEETYRIVTNTCHKIFPHTSGSLCMMDPEQTMLQEVASWGNPPDEIRKFGLDDPWIFDHDKTDYIEHPDTGRLYTHIGYSMDHRYMCVPISISGEILAILSLNFESHDCVYGDDNESTDRLEAIRIVLTGIAEPYALALVNLRLRETLRKESLRDPLTGLYNRRHMEASLIRESRRVQRHNSSLGVMMLDVDHFKIFNDTYGHEAGDIVLQELGLLLQRHIRGEDITCRYGGEEFLVILPDASLAHTEFRAEELRIMAKELQIKYQEKILKITVSIGVAALPHHSIDPKEVLIAADAALYQAKAEGRDRVVVASSKANSSQKTKL